MEYKEIELKTFKRIPLCPLCQGELQANMGYVYMTNPAQYDVTCACGYKTTLTMKDLASIVYKEV